MSADQRWRSTERELAVTPDDAAGWIRLSHTQERAGDVLAAGGSAVRAAAFGADSEVIARARALGWEGFWPAAAGQGGSRRSPLLGPEGGVLRWRHGLPCVVQGAPLVTFQGEVALLGASAGLVQHSASGESTQLGAWDASVAPVLFRGAPAGLDPARLSFGRGPVWPAALGPGRIYASDGATLLALSAETYVAWRARVELTQLVVGPLGPVFTSEGPPRLVSLDLQGEPRFRRELSRRQRGAALAVTSSALVLAGPGGTLCLDPRDGAQRWQVAGEVSRNLLALDDAHLYSGHRQRGLFARTLERGDVVWARPDLGGVAAVLRDGESQLLALRDAQVLSLDAESGATRWALPLSPAAPLSGIALGPERVAYVAAGGELLAIG